MCTVPLPPGVYPIAVDKYIIISYIIKRGLTTFHKHMNVLGGENLELPS
jgi:hypothetical protein